MRRSVAPYFVGSGCTYCTTGSGRVGGGAMATGAGEITTGRTGGGTGDVGVSRMCARDISVGVGALGGACAGLSRDRTRVKHSCRSQRKRQPKKKKFIISLRLCHKIIRVREARRVITCRKLA